MRKLILATTVAGLLAGSAQAQIVLTNDWFRDMGPTPYVPYLGDDNNTRGGDLNPATGNYLIADRDGTAGNRIHVWNGADGTDTTTVFDNTTTEADPHTLFKLNKVEVSADGVIYVSGLLTNVPNNYEVYYYPNEAAGASPALAATTGTTTKGGISATVRMGDAMAAAGSGTGRVVVVGGSANPDALKFVDPENDGTYAASVLTGGGVLNSAGIPNMGFNSTGTVYYIRRSGGAAAGPPLDYTPYETKRVNVADGSSAGANLQIHPMLKGPVDDDQVPLEVAAVTGGNIGGTEVIAVQGYAGTATTLQSVRALVYDVINVATPLAETTSLGVGGGSNAAAPSRANANGSGAITIDSVNNKLYVLGTNNSVSRWDLSPLVSSETDWNLY